MRERKRISKTVLDKLRAARKAGGWSASRVGAEVGVSARTIHRWEAGTRWPCAESLDAWAYFLAVTVR